jgi:hypothetical protein
MAVAVTADAHRFVRTVTRRLRAAGVARAGQRLVQLGLEHGLQEFAGSIAQPGFDRIKLFSSRKGAPMARYGVISAGAQNAGIACWIKLEITPPSLSNHSRYGTPT